MPDSRSNFRHNDYALIIGINDYLPTDDGGLPPLSGAISDAESIAKWLMCSDGGNLPIENCLTLFSSAEPRKPLQEAIDYSLDTIFKKVQNNGGHAARFYFYFSGHGFAAEGSESDIAMCVANWSSTRRRSAISSKEYVDLFVRYKVFDEVIFWADCCRNASYRLRPMGPSLDVFYRGDVDTVYMIANSTQYMDQAFEIKDRTDGVTKGVFSELLIKGLKGEAATKDGVINSHSLKAYLEIHVPIEAQKHGYKQIPQIMTTANEKSIVFKHGALQQYTTCVISISEANIGEIEILNGELASVKIITITEKGNVEIDLLKGIYVIRNLTTKVEHFFLITANKELQNVSF
ncbi:caspase family protein [Sphingobacterium faecium]|uniref:caspase family protein n=1 Tax=Sphingobacterium faecium TaxID=34087 RepID=UPI003209EE62